MIWSNSFYESLSQTERVHDIFGQLLSPCGVDTHISHPCHNFRSTKPTFLLARLARELLVIQYHPKTIPVCIPPSYAHDSAKERDNLRDDIIRRR